MPNFHTKDIHKGMLFNDITVTKDDKFQEKALHNT